jgi:hypothetical protein
MVQKVQMENVLVFFLADKRILKQAKINKKIPLAHSMVKFSEKGVIFKTKMFSLFCFNEQFRESFF